MTGTPRPSPEHDVEPPVGTAGNTGPNPLAGLQKLVAELFLTSSGARFGLSLEQFTGILEEAVAKHLATDAAVEALREFISKLHVEELALARACAAGNDAAWEAFLLRYRESLYEAGIAIAKDYSLGRELADSLYAELWGAGGSQRTSPLLSYMGYGSLEGWLRTTMARSFIDRYRSQRRLVSLEQETEQGWEPSASPAQPVVPVDPRLEQATDQALRELDSEDRFILGSFFLHGRTLAEVAQVLRRHESTLSRRVNKITTNLRKQILRGMTRRGMSRREAEEALAADVRDLEINVRARLEESLQETPIAPSPQQEAETAKAKDEQ
jgi:RNA polymerase sigma-70 factor, ECF subfamily